MGGVGGGGGGRGVVEWWSGWLGRTLFAFGSDVTFQRVHLDLNALVFPFGLSGFTPVDEQNDNGDEDEKDAAARDAADRFGRERVRFHELVAQVT